MLLLLLACSDSPDAGPIRLRWVRGFEGDRWEDAERGMYWQLASLGARPPADGSAVSMIARDDDGALLTLDPHALGLPEAGLAALLAATDAIEASDEVERFGGLDLGAFFLLTLYDPWDYYAVTGACPTLAEWEAGKVRERERDWFAVTNSFVSFGERVLRLPAPTGSATDIALAAEEGRGSSLDGSFEAHGVEVIDVLPSGQLRYAVYGEGGELEAAVDPTLSAAGQPGACMWCHEDSLEHALDTNEPVEGSLSTEAFLETVARMQGEVEALQAGLDVSVDFEEHEVHTFGELLTETFLAPSPGRLAREWGVPEAEVRAALDPASLVVNPEYPDHGEVTTREAATAAFRALVDPAFLPLPTLASARELDPADLPRPSDVVIGCAAD